MIKKYAPGEDRTHDLKIMRLTRCRLRYRGYTIELLIMFFFNFFRNIHVNTDRY
jgi:hypothetical protein